MNIIEIETQKIIASSIYKYGPFNNMCRTLEQCTLGFSPLDSFNDIYESDYKLKHFFHSIDDEKVLIDGPVTPFMKISRLVESNLKTIRVSCFSYTPNNNLMWAHYASNHEGICYCFEFDGKKTPFEPVTTDWGNVIYSSSVPELKVFQDQTTEGMLSVLLTDVILTKSLDWSYEKELRFFRSQKENHLKFYPRSLRAIIVGRRVSDELIDSIEKSIGKFEVEHNHKIQLLYAHRVATKYDLGIHSNKSYRDSCETNFSVKIPVLDGILSEPLTYIKSENGK